MATGQTVPPPDGDSAAGRLGSLSNRLGRAGIPCHSLSALASRLAARR